MKVKRFEDLIAWQRSRELFRLVHELTSKPPISKNPFLRNQMKSASLSVMSNVAEGFNRGGDKEFVQFLHVSKGSCSELRSQLHAVRDLGYLEVDEFKSAFDLVEETSRLLQGLITSIKRAMTGRKFTRDS